MRTSHKFRFTCPQCKTVREGWALHGSTVTYRCPCGLKRVALPLDGPENELWQTPAPAPQGEAAKT